MLRKVRVILGASFFLGVTLLFLDFTGTMHHWLSWMAKVQFLPAAMALNIAVVASLAALTLLFGRIYCSVVCPLGVMQDIIAWLGGRTRKNRYSYSKEVGWLRYTMLAVMIAAMAAGAGAVVQLLAPYSAFGRIATMLLQPLWLMCNNVLAYVAERCDSYAFYTVDVWMRSLPVLVAALLTLAILAVLAWRGGRTYCNTVCPVGTALSFLSRFSLLKIRFDADKCRSCSLCTKNCKAACIDYTTHTVDYSRCVVCGDCIDKCRFGALTLAARPSAKACASRRSLLVTAALTATAALAQEKKKVDGGLAEIVGKKAPERQTPIAPPGARSLKNMSSRCTGCLLCVSECPNGVLRPDLHSSLFSLQTSFMQPVMDNIGVIKEKFRPSGKEALKIQRLMDEGKIVIEPLAFIRGRSLGRSFFIIDEAQNLTPHEVKTIITRAAEGTKVVFTGDTLFRMSIGRTDFERGSYADIMHSLQHVLAALPADTKVYTGHGPQSTIGDEQQYNPYMNA